MTQLLDALKWRYAIKKMDASKKVAEHDIAQIQEAVKLSATSYGLQPFKVLNIKNQELRQKLQPLAWNQSQITEASHLFIFCNQLEVTDRDVEEYIELKAKISGIDTKALSGYGDFVKVKMKEKSSVEMEGWTAKQTYIALSSALAMCAELKIDATPIEGFEVSAFNEKLSLNEKGLNAAVLLAVGYRDAEDGQQNAPKVRKSIAQLFEEI